MRINEKKSFNDPCIEEKFDKCKLKIVNFNDGKTYAAMCILEPGWKWSECVGPEKGLDKCPTDHFGFIVSGTMICVDEAGNEVEYSAGDVYLIPPGHDAWVVGDEKVVGYEFSENWNTHEIHL